MADKHGGGPLRVRMNTNRLILLAVSLLVAGVIAVAVRGAVSPLSAEHRALERMHHVRSEKGPWGDLRVLRVVIEPSEEAWRSQLKSERPTWAFRDYTTNDYERLLSAAGLTRAQRVELETAAVWDPSGKGCRVSPSDDCVMGLLPEAREVLYSALALFPENLFQNEPFRFRTDLATLWFEDSGLSKDVIDHVQRLSYKRGNTLMFSDPHLVLPKLASDAERLKLLKTLARQPTLLVQLHLAPGADIDALVHYWASKESFAEDIRPLLDSAARIEDGVDLDITHLLPRFARKRLYTYPRADGDAGETGFDCHWTSMNFWNDPPDNRFANRETVIRTLTTDYAPVKDTFRFGDVLMFMKSQTEAVHSAVYIADNIVFTKNGPSPFCPWTLMKMESLFAHYETTADLTIRGYRKKSDR